MSSIAHNAVLGSRVDPKLKISDCRAVSDSPVTDSKGDVALVLEARRGNRTAFGALYARFSPMVHGILLAKVPSSDVEDLLQDVFLRALPKLGDLRDASRFGAWLAAIARNRANDFHRQSRPVAAVTDSLTEDDGELPDTKPKTNLLEGTMILGLIRELPDTYRETLILRLVEGMTGPEIAERTGLTHGSVRVNLHRGMQQLKLRLSQGPNAAQTPSAHTDRTAGKSRTNPLRGRTES